MRDREWRHWKDEYQLEQAEPQVTRFRSFPPARFSFVIQRFAFLIPKPPTVTDPLRVPSTRHGTLLRPVIQFDWKRYSNPGIMVPPET